MPLVLRDFAAACVSRLPGRARRLVDSPTGRRMIRFAPAAAVALAATQLTYLLCGTMLHLTGRLTGAAGWLAGAAVSYVVTRWAWQRRGRPDLLRETLPFLAVSLPAGAVLIEASHLAYQEAGSLGLHGLTFYAFAQGCYLTANCVTFIARFVIFNLVVFADRRPGAAGLGPWAAGLGPVFAGWYRRGRGLIGQTGKFGLVGLAGLVVTDGGANLLRYRAGMDDVTALAVATVVATVVTFLGNRYWTYTDRARTGLARETVLFFAVNGAGIAVSEVPVVAARHLLGLDTGLSYNAAVLTGIALATVLRYWAYRAWIWRAAPASSTPVLAASASASAPAASAPAAPASAPVAGWVAAAGQTPVVREALVGAVPEPAPAAGQAPAGSVPGAGWPRRFAGGCRGLLPELARFAVVTAGAFVMSDLVMSLLRVPAGVRPGPAAVTGAALAMILSFAGNRYWTFRHRLRATVSRDGFRYLLLSCAGLLIEVVALQLSAGLGLRGGGVLAAGAGLSLLARFWACRAWVWRPRPAAAA